MKKLLIIPMLLSSILATAPKVEASTTNNTEDKVFFIKRDENVGRTGNFTVLKSNGKYAIVDSGDTNIDVNKEFVKKQLQDIGVTPGTKFEFVFVTHLDQDHYNLMTKDNLLPGHKRADGWLLDEYKVEKLYLQEKPSHPDYARLTEALKVHGAQISTFKPETKVAPISFGDFTLTVWNNHNLSEKEIAVNKATNRKNENFNSVSVVVRKEDKSLLIGGDMTYLDEQDMISSGEVKQMGNIDVFAMNHHGTIETLTQEKNKVQTYDLETNSDAYLNAINPKAMIVTAGEAYLDAHYKQPVYKAEQVWLNKKASWRARTKNNLYFDYYGIIQLDFTNRLTLTQGNTIVDVKNQTVLPGKTNHVYRLKLGERTLLTSNPAEINTLVRNGWKNEGILFTSNSTKRVYRFYSPQRRTHLFTSNEVEIERLKAWGWIYEGFAFHGTTQDPVIRYFNGNDYFYIRSKQHHWLDGNKWRPEGRAF